MGLLFYLSCPSWPWLSLFPLSHPSIRSSAFLVAVNVIEWGIFFPLSPWHEYPHTYTHTHSLSLFLPDVARAIELLEKLQESGDVPGHKLQSLKKVLQSEFCTAIREVSHCQGREPLVRERQHNWYIFILSLLWDSFYFFDDLSTPCYGVFPINHFLGVAFEKCVALSPVQSQLLCCPSQDLNTFFCLFQTNQESSSKHSLAWTLHGSYPLTL